MACGDTAEAAQVSEQLSQVNTGLLITYRTAQDVLLNAPSGSVALIILASTDDPVAIIRILQWMRRRWPHCLVTVIGDVGSGGLELAARKGGANFLARPVTREQWHGILSPVLPLPERAAKEEWLG
jgi:hypothetical protein